jgi:mannosylfructose-phosphate synthase
MTVNNKIKKKINRICILNPQGYIEYPPPLGKTDTGGQITYILELAKALGKKGIKVDIVTRKFDNRPTEETIFDNVKIVRIACGSNKFIPKEKLYEVAAEMAENILEYLNHKNKKYDLIHSHYWDGGYVGLTLAKVLNIPHIHTPHSLGKWKKLEMALEETSPQKLKPIYRYQVRIAAEQKILNRVDAVILQAESLRIKILEHYMVDLRNYLLFFPVLIRMFIIRTTNKYDKQINLVKNSILTVSRMVPNKGIDRLLDAANLIKNKIDFHIYIGGGGAKNIPKSVEEEEFSKKIYHLIKKYHLSEKVTILGHIESHLLPSYYRKADLLVFPSRYEPFGIVPLESMACGTTSIVSNSAGCREIIIDGLNGFIINPHDRKKLAEIILQLLKDEKLRNKVAQNAAFTIKEHYSWNKVADKFIELYHKILLNKNKL